MTTEEDVKVPLHKVSHFRQRAHWDCGVSCVLMLLSQDQREHFLRHYREICDEEGIQESTWTIDLCYLLKRFDIEHNMYTTTAGVNEEYRNTSYYSNIIDIDRTRVERRFKQALTSGILIQEQSITSAQLLAHLKTGPAIMLVDAGILACSICKHNKIKSEFRSCFGGSYKGHYILVVDHWWWAILATSSCTATPRSRRDCAPSHTPACTERPQLWAPMMTVYSYTPARSYILLVGHSRYKLLYRASCVSISMWVVLIKLINLGSGKESITWIIM